MTNQNLKGDILEATIQAFHATGVAIDQIPITPHVLFAKFTEAGLIKD